MASPSLLLRCSHCLPHLNTVQDILLGGRKQIPYATGVESRVFSLSLHLKET